MTATPRCMRSNPPLMFSIAYLQDPGHGKLRIEEQMLQSEFTRRGVPVELYPIKRIREAVYRSAGEALA